MNEFQLIDLITESTKRMSDELLLGVGDDCAVLSQADHDLLVTVDSFTENIHFKLMYFDPHTLGNRLINASASDIAAMGGRPKEFFVSLGIPSGFLEDRCSELYDGMKSYADRVGMILAGGDTISNPDRLHISISILGKSEKGKWVPRSGAKPGDAIYVTGTMGDASTGLACLEKGYTTSPAEYFISRYKEPAARLEAGEWLSKTDLVSSMIDVSDGLLADLGHLADSSDTGYEILMRDIPTHDGIHEVTKALGIDSKDMILSGGDDYELAFTVKGESIAKFDQMLKSADLPFDHGIARIGSMTEAKDRRAVLKQDGTEEKISTRGYDHLGGNRK